MATGTWAWYSKGLQAITTGAVDLDTDTFKAMLTTSAYTPSKDTHDYRDDVTNEVTGTGYSAGGVAVTGMAVSYDAASDQVRVDFNDPTFSTVTITGVRTIVLYKSRGGASSADELVAYCTLDADVDVSTGDLVFPINAAGALYIDNT